MAEGLDATKLQNIVECSICLEQFKSPKMLKCSHEFCLECLENILEFHNDGSASISCPLRCEARTIIGAEEFVADLPTPYTTKNVLDLVNASSTTDDETLTSAKNCEDCSKPATKLCCEQFMCNSCFDKHNDSDYAQWSHGRTRPNNVLYNRKDGSLNLICSSHPSPYTHVCMEHYCSKSLFEKLLCVYCMNRDSRHQDHPKGKISDQALLVRSQLENMANEFERIQEFQSLTQEYISSVEHTLCEVLCKRKEEALNQYSKFLDSEEKTLIDEYRDHAAMALNMRTTEVLYSGVKRTLEQTDIELVMEKHLTDGRKAPKYLGSHELTLTKSAGVLSQRPLGEFKDAVDWEDNPVSGDVVSIFQLLAEKGEEGVPLTDQFSDDPLPTLIAPEAEPNYADLNGVITCGCCVTTTDEFEDHTKVEENAEIDQIASGSSSGNQRKKQTKKSRKKKKKDAW